MTVPIPPWEPKIVVDDNDPDVARIDLPAQHEKGQNRPHLLLDASPDTASWQSATISILEFGLPIRRTRDARNLARALLAGTAWVERKSLQDVGGALLGGKTPTHVLQTEELHQAAQHVIADIEKFSPDSTAELIPRPNPDFDPRIPGSRLRGQVDYRSSHAIYRGPEGEWTLPWEVK